ncbi:MAG TPA: T9SS type A sorting domain-containing protein [Bacteroidales bacterium]|nr:T9SS type A sorting domain-containing protein [Bacteroidales bacterium]
MPGTVRMYDLSGKLRYEYILNSEIVQFVQFDLSPGVYMLFLYVGSDVRHTQKIVVIR